MKIYTYPSPGIKLFEDAKRRAENKHRAEARGTLRRINEINACRTEIERCEEFIQFAHVLPMERVTSVGSGMYKAV